MSSSLARYNVDGNMNRHDSNLAQLQLFTVRNGEAVTHHFSYDRPEHDMIEQMGSARWSASC